MGIRLQRTYTMTNVVDGEVIMATGDNGNKMFIWEDCTLEENSREVAENQMRLQQLL